MPNYIGNESHDSHNNVRVQRHFEHPGDTIRVQHIPIPISLLIEEWGWMILADHEQLDMITGVASIEYTQPARVVKTTGIWSRPLLLAEDTPQPLPKSLEVFLVFVVKANQETEDEGRWSLEWAIIGKRSGGNDEEVEEETEGSETDDDAGDNVVDKIEVLGKSIAKEEESGLEHERQTFHDEVEAPGDRPVHLALSIPATIDNGSTYLDPGITVEPLLAQHGDKRGEERSSQTRVNNCFDADDGGLGTIPLRERVICGGWSISKRSIGDNHQEIVAHFLEVRFELALNIENESRCDCRE